MANGYANKLSPPAAPLATHTKLNRQQITGFWAA
jgi:hypothetical protein